MKNRHQDFPSDIFLTLSACDATLAIGDAISGATSEVKVIDILKTDLSNKIILSVELPPIEHGTFVSNYRNWN